MTRLMDRFIDSIEWIAALFIGVVAADIFISVLLRYFFGIQIPDAYDFGQAMLGILIFWGIAATSYRGTHITVDLLWSNVPPKWQRVIDVFATLVLLFVVVLNVIGAFQVFGQVYMITRGGPELSTRTLVQYIYETAFNNYRMGYAAALSWLLFLIIAVFSVIQFRMLRER